MVSLEFPGKGGQRLDSESRAFLSGLAVAGVLPLRGFAQHAPLTGMDDSSGTKQASQEKVKQEPSQGSGRQQPQHQIAHGSETLDPCPHDTMPAPEIGAAAD
jgi:hypothetical protein